MYLEAEDCKLYIPLFFFLSLLPCFLFLTFECIYARRAGKR